MTARPWVRVGRLGAALLALATVLDVGRAEAVPPGSAHKPVPAASASVTIRQVTLVTGDRVVVNIQGKQPTVVDIVPGPGRSHMSFATLAIGGRLRVVPADAMRLIQANRVDPRLFDVTALLRFGYDDRRTDVPVLMLGSAATAASANAARAATRTAAKAAAMRNVPGGAAFHVPKSSAGAFWRAFAAASGGAAPAVAPGPKLWLDAIRQVSLKDSVPQIGAPAAWAAGFTGAGVIVGVVDTGIDSAHPDLAGRVIAAQDFTGSNDTRDLVGHGTHVAATIASVDSVFRGVAPDAHLVSAKACDDSGCSESSLLAAIQYAIDNGAKIINMSLGGPDSPGADPLEAAVNALTAADGVLFVIAAGNDGGVGIESPGSADAALTVGAVDKSDQLASFSSQGPRNGDDAIKPDITAPGVDITAARSKDGEFGNPGDLRVALDGTSMATPHVAGSAAILLQEHPTWTPAQLKQALMGSARRNTDLGPFQQGAGRVDVAHEIGQTVLADPPSVSFATEVFPHTDDAPDGRTVTYHNTAASPVTLQLSLDDPSAPAGMFTLSTSSLTVPAGGSASVTLTSDTNLDVPDDHYTGYLMAQTPTGAVSTPFAVFKQPKSSTITFHFLDRDGQPTQNASGVLIDPSTGDFIQAPGDGQSMTLRDGTYAYVAQLFDEDGSTSMLAEPVLTIDGDRDLTADARDAKPVTISVPFAGAQTQLLEAAVQIDTPAGPGTSVAFGFGTPLYIGATDPAVTAPYVSAVVRGVFSVPPRPGADLTDDVSVMYHRIGRLYDGFTRTVMRSELATFPVEYATDGPTDAVTLAQPFWPDLADSPLGSGSKVVLPARRTEYLNVNDGVRWRRELIVIGAQGPDYILSSAPDTFKGGQTYPERRNAPVFGPGFEVLPPGAFSIPPISRQGDTLNVIPTVANDRLNWLNIGLSDTGPTTVTLSRNGRQIASQQGGFDVDVPPGNATYKLSVDANRGGVDTLSTSIHAEWTFHSDTTPATAFAAIPVQAIRFTPDLSLIDTAPAGRPLTVPVDIQNEPTSPASAVRNVTVQVSYDDGATWHNVVLTGTGAHRLAVIPSPASGFVSLRATATNTAGNSVSETIIRAYAVV